MKIVLAGGSGFIGQRLAHSLVDSGHQVIILSRRPTQSSFKTLIWDGERLGGWVRELEDIDVMINLSGEGIGNHRWTPQQKSKLYASRILSTNCLVEAANSLRKKPQVFINASAVGFYGPIAEGEVTESAPAGSDFLASLCQAWEDEAHKAEKIGMRVVILRFGVVLEKDGGALAKMLTPFRFFMGGPLGSGQQWMPWVHREDVIGSILFALQNKNLNGPVNVTSPNPVRMKDFCSVLAKILNRPSWLPAPAFVLKFLLGEMSTLLLTGQKAVPTKLTQAGYKFQNPLLEPTLHQILQVAR